MQLSVEGEIIGRFASIKEAGRVLGIGYRGIVEVLKERRHISGGFKWAYAEQN